METNLELVKTELDGELIQTVNARELYQKLGGKRKFVNWLQDKVSTYDFKEGLDYVTKMLKTPNGRPRNEYYLSIDMAKELCMLEKNEVGRKYRKYFIELEKSAGNNLALSNENLIKIMEDKMIKLTTNIEKTIEDKMNKLATSVSRKVVYIKLPSSERPLNVQLSDAVRKYSYHNCISFIKGWDLVITKVSNIIGVDAKKEARLIGLTVLDYISINHLLFDFVTTANALNE